MNPGKLGNLIKETSHTGSQRTGSSRLAAVTTTVSTVATPHPKPTQRQVDSSYRFGDTFDRFYSAHHVAYDLIQPAREWFTSRMLLWFNFRNNQRFDPNARDVPSRHLDLSADFYYDALPFDEQNMISKSLMLALMHDMAFLEMVAAHKPKDQQGMTGREFIAWSRFLGLRPQKALPYVYSRGNGPDGFFERKSYNPQVRALLMTGPMGRLYWEMYNKIVGLDLSPQDFQDYPHNDNDHVTRLITQLRDTSPSFEDLIGHARQYPQIATLGAVRISQGAKR